MSGNVLLISEKAVKQITNCNDNVFAEYIGTAISTAQDIGLQGVIGSCLYERICDMVSDGSITDSGNTAYKYLLDNQIRYYLAWKVIADIIPVVAVKINNGGAVLNTDEHRNHLSQKDFDLLVSHYQDICDSYRLMLQNYLKAYGDLFPELADCGCGGIKPNLDSSNSSSVWLGGFRGRIYTGNDCGC